MTPTQPTNGHPIPPVYAQAAAAPLPVDPVAAATAAPLPPAPAPPAYYIDASLDSPAPVPLVLGKVTYLMSYRAFAFIEYAKVKGTDLMADLLQLQLDGKRLREGQATDAPMGLAKLFEVACDVIWAGAIELQPNVTRAMIQRSVGFPEIKRAMVMFDSALYATLPKPNPDAVENPNPNPTQGVNTGLGSSPASTPIPESTPTPSAG